MKIVQRLLLLCAFILTLAVKSNACTTPGLAAAVGNNTTNPPTSYVTSIVANGTSVINVTTYNPQTGAVDTSKFISLGTSGAPTATGSWTGGPGIYVTRLDFSSNLMTINGGAATITLSQGAWAELHLAWLTGGLTQFASIGDGKTMNVRGFNSGGYQGSQTTLFGTCVTPNYNSIVSSNDASSCAIVSGAVKCWGYGGYGTLGNGTTNTSNVPVQVTGITSGATTISVGDVFACAVVSGGVKCWGFNNRGQLGDNTTTTRTSPVSVSGLTSGVVGVSAGSSHACAVLSTGVIKCWGSNDHGELGNNSVVESHVPVQVNLIASGAQMVSAGTHSTCAVVSGGAKCWGYNFYGELGINSTAEQHQPVAVTGLGSNVALIKAGNETTCANDTSGALQCWGWNGLGQIGNGNTTNQLLPTAVSGMSAFAGIPASPSSATTCVAMSTGVAKCWGFNFDGEIGDNTTVTPRLTPTQVFGVSGGTAEVSAGQAHTCASINGHVFCWGYGGNGELGNGTFNNSLVPVQVSGL